MKYRNRLVGSVASVCLWVLAGCAGEDSGPAAAPEELIESWVHNLHLSEEVAQAERRLVRECMEVEGFDVHPPYDAHVPNETEIRAQILNRPDFDTVDEIGYRDLLEASGNEIVDESWFDDPQYQTDYTYALMGDEAAAALYNEDIEEQVDRSDTGVALNWPGMEVHELPDGTVVEWPTGGCEGTVLDELYGGEILEFKQLEVAASPVGGAEVLEDERLQEAHAEWSACMEEAGYSELGRPQDAQVLAREWYAEAASESPDPFEDSSGGFNDAQIALARADRDCSQASSVDEIHDEVYFEHLTDKIVENEVAFFDYRVEAEAVLETAARMLTGSSLCPYATRP